MSTAARRILYARQIDHGILIEKARRRQSKPADHTGLHRMILGPWQVMHAEAVPQDYIRVLNRPILLSPGRQAIISGRLVHELPSRIPLTRLIRSHPNLVLLEAAPLS